MEISHGTVDKRLFQALRTEISKDRDRKSHELQDGNNKWSSLVKGEDRLSESAGPVHKSPANVWMNLLLGWTCDVSTVGRKEVRTVDRKKGWGVPLQDGTSF